MNRLSTLVVASFFPLGAMAQSLMSVDECIAYAVEHNLDVSRTYHRLSDAEADRLEASGAFLPSVSGSVGAAYNFGRAIDPQTNVYTNVNTFQNGYNLEAYLPLFEGLRRLHALRLSQYQVLKGTEGVSAAKDEVALRVFAAYVDAAFYRGMVDMSEQKLEASLMLMREATMLEELGRKSHADVLQVRASLAADEAELTRVRGQLAQSLLALKRVMNFPLSDAIVLDTAIVQPLRSDASADEVFHVARSTNPLMRQTYLGLEAAKHGVGVARSALMPRLAVGANVSSSYFSQSGAAEVQSFASQVQNNVGRSVYAQLSIPLFGRLAGRAQVRRSQNALRQASDDVLRQERELQSLIEQTIAERDNALREMEQMLLTEEADSLACRATVRRFEEGQASAIEVRQQQTQWLQSRARLLQCRLTLALKQRMINYYNGQPLW